VPGSQPRTASPVATTVPAHSWPSTEPARANCSSTRCRSVPQIPQCEISTRTSVGPSDGTGSSSTSMRPPPWYTAATIAGRAISRDA